MRDSAIKALIPPLPRFPDLTRPTPARPDHRSALTTPPPTAARAPSSTGGGGTGMGSWASEWRARVKTFKTTLTDLNRNAFLS